jgi:hypothetical protein
VTSKYATLGLHAPAAAKASSWPSMLSPADIGPLSFSSVATTMGLQSMFGLSDAFLLNFSVANPYFLAQSVSTNSSW